MVVLGGNVENKDKIYFLNLIQISNPIDLDKVVDIVKSVSKEYSISKSQLILLFDGWC